MVAEGNVGVAFGLVAAAGAATCLGACIVWCASLAQPKLLAGSLGFAAGVMLYVSFGEILMRKSVSGFQAVNADPDAAFRWSTLCFFGGMAIIAVLDQLVHVVADWGARRSHKAAGGGCGGDAHANASTANLLSHEDQREAAATGGSRRGASRGGGMRRARGGSSVPAVDAALPGAPPPVALMGRRDVEETGSAACSPRSARQGAGAGGEAALGAHPAGSDNDSDSASMDGRMGGLSAPGPLTEPCDPMTSAVVAASCPETVVGSAEDGAGSEGQGGGAGGGGGGTATASRTPPAVVEIMEADHHAFMLKKMGLLTALAIFIHNFPEGLATFVGALADTKVGVGLAVAIAMHNIPEGICVAMPIYYATGSRWKGFFWALLSGASEPLGALVGYLALNGGNDLSFAIVFGLVAGMMVYISVKELIPTALRYDPQDKVATTAVVAGMAVMAASLLLFTI